MVALVTHLKFKINVFQTPFHQLQLFPHSSYLGKLASTAKDPKITRAFVKLVQEMWKGASNNRTGYSSNHGVAEPAIFRREMTVFAPKFGGYDQVRWRPMPD